MKQSEYSVWAVDFKIDDTTKDTSLLTSIIEE
jgi:hypothetical protein